MTGVPVTIDGTIYLADAHPEHPIALPVPPTLWPDPPEGQEPIISHPIVIPPPIAVPPATRKLELKVAWTQETGWVVVLVPTGPTPTPSRR